MPLDLVDEVSALLPSKNDIRADDDERREVGKHANHDQKSHGNCTGGPYAAQLASVSESDLDPANLRPAAAGT